MPNHFHLVAQCYKAECYSEWMHWLTTTHAKRYLKHYGGSGHVWQGRFKSFAIQENEYFLTVLRYVEANPVRAGLVQFAMLWKWASFAERFTGDSQKLLEKSPLALPSFWNEWVDQAIGDGELKVIRNSVNRQVPYGKSEWQEKVCKILGLESLLKPLGRPKKKRS
jgi:putative transposase